MRRAVQRRWRKASIGIGLFPIFYDTLTVLPVATGAIFGIDLIPKFKLRLGKPAGFCRERRFRFFPRSHSFEKGRDLQLLESKC
jgi:hypothetical protein